MMQQQLPKYVEAIAQPGASTTDVLTAREAAEFLRIHHKTLLKLAQARKVPAVRLGRQWRFSRDQLEKIISTRLGRPAILGRVQSRFIP